MKILAFAASSSRQSINKKLATYAAGLVGAEEVEVLDINDYEMPIFSQDREAELGHPQQAHDFLKKIAEADALIIAFAEHNGSYTAAFKNLYDWSSRINTKVYQGKPVVMLATSPGPGGAKNVLATATSSAPHFGADLKGQLSVARFHEHFDVENNVISSPEVQSDLVAALAGLK